MKDNSLAAILLLVFLPLLILSSAPRTTEEELQREYDNMC